MSAKRPKISKTVVYQAPSGALELRGDFERETLWATQPQMAMIFGTTPQNINIHLKNIYKEKELNERATSKESLLVQMEGKRHIKRKVKEYSLEVLIAVGYRVNSVIGTKFRQWATKTLREHVTRGYTINRKQIGRNYDAFMKAVADVLRCYLSVFRTC